VELEFRYRWLVASAGLNAEAIQSPTGGRAPGWNAGLVVAQRQRTRKRVDSQSYSVTFLKRRGGD